MVAAHERALARPQPEEAVDLANTLIGVYRRADVVDPKTYVTAASATLADYPAHIAKRVASPVTGLPSRLKFLPTIAEIREACEAEMNRQRNVVARAKWMLQERDKRERAAREKLEAEHNRVSPERVAEILNVNWAERKSA